MKLKPAQMKRAIRIARTRRSVIARTVKWVRQRLQSEEMALYAMIPRGLVVAVGDGETLHDVMNQHAKEIRRILRSDGSKAAQAYITSIPWAVTPPPPAPMPRRQTLHWAQRNHL